MNTSYPFLFLMLQETGPRAITIPNALGPHTWFIIIVVGAFLAWSISYSLQLQKEALKRKAAREGSLQQRNDLLNEIAALESKKEAGKIGEQQYEQEFRKLKSRLSRVLERSRQQNRDTSAES